MNSKIQNMCYLNIQLFLVCFFCSILLPSAAYAGLPVKAEYKKSFTKKLSQTNSKRDVLEVGAGKIYRLPSEAAKHAKDGDIIQIDASLDYLNDNVIWKQDNLIIEGVNGIPKITSSKIITNGKAQWVVKGNNIRIQNIEFSGAKVRDKNGAGLRIEGTNAYIKNCYFHHNENGILAGRNNNSTITVINSEFSHNGYGKGRTHNIYIGAIKKLRFVGNFSHHAIVGHALKSRAKRNEILYNKFMDGNDGNSSYLVDLSNGGYSIIMGNIIQQSNATENWTLFAYGMEGLPKKRDNKIYITFNTFVNNRSSGIFINTKNKASGIVANNIFSGKGRLLKGNLEKKYNIKTTDHDYFADASIFDYRLKGGLSFLNKSTIIKTSEGQQLIPEFQFGHRGLVKRALNGSAYDPGAFEHWYF